MNTNTRTSPSPNPCTTTPLHAYTGLALLVNRVIDTGPLPDLSFDDVFEAAREHRLLPLLAQRYSDQADFTWVTHPHAATLSQMEATLSNAAAAFAGRVGRPTGPFSGLCLVQAIILEAIQQQFHRPQPPLPDDLPAQPYLPFVNRTRSGWPPNLL